MSKKREINRKKWCKKRRGKSKAKVCWQRGLDNKFYARPCI